MPCTTGILAFHAGGQETPKLVFDARPAAVLRGHDLKRVHQPQQCPPIAATPGDPIRLPSGWIVDMPHEVICGILETFQMPKRLRHSGVQKRDVPRHLSQQAEIRPHVVDEVDKNHGQIPFQPVEERSFVRGPRHGLLGHLGRGREVLRSTGPLTQPNQRADRCVDIGVLRQTRRDLGRPAVQE